MKLTTKIKNIYKKVKSGKAPAVETKSGVYDNYLNFIGALNNANIDVNTFQSLLYYTIISSVSIGVDLIGDEFEALKPMIWDKQEKKFVEGGQFEKILNLLNHPNSDQTKTELLGAISRFYTITGNAYIMASLSSNGEILELENVNPLYIDIEGYTKDQFVDYYNYQSGTGNIQFNRKEEREGFRYLNADETLELWHIRYFSPKTGQSSLRGLSRLNSIYLEINQIFQSNKHNLSMLLQGITSSGILTSETPLGEGQRDDVRKQISSDNAGSSNAGRIFFFDGGKFDFKELSKSMKDMDFKELKEMNKNDVYARLKIPKELVGETATFENQHKASLRLYDNVIIPLSIRIFTELSLFIFPHFKIDPNRYTLVFNVFDVQVLKEREVQNVKQLKEMNIFTIDELRQQLAHDAVPGGDVIYQPLNLVPIGTSQLILNREQTKAKKLKEALKDIKYKNGDNVYCIGE